MNLEIKDDVLYISFQYDPVVVDKVNKNGLGMTYLRKTRTWKSSLSMLFVQSFLRFFPEQRINLYNILPGKYKFKVNDTSSFFDESELLPCLMDHQKRGVLDALKRPRILFNWDCGIGKTLLSIEVIYQLIRLQKIKKALVLCPLSIIESAWIEDIKTFRPFELSVTNLWFVKKKKKNILQNIIYNDISIVNYETFKLLSKHIQKYFQCVICDESSKLKNHKSQITKATIEFCDNIEYVYLLSGLPAPNTPIEYWAQMRIVDPLSLGYNFYTFRDKYFYIAKTMIKRSKEAGKKDIEINKYKINETYKHTFYNKLKQYMPIVKKTDVLDLPSYTINIREVFLSSAERKYYDQMKNKLLIELDGETAIARSAVTKIMKLRQGCSGFFISEDGEIIETGKSKLNELEQLLIEIGDQQVIIWNFFHYEGDIITDLLTKLDKTWCRADGTRMNKSKMYQEVDDFKNEQIQFLVAHPGSIGHGWTLINCSNVICFSQSHSYELYHQLFARTYRKGQTKGVNYYNLITKNTIEPVIYHCLRHKKSLDEEVMNYIKYSSGRNY